MPIHACTLPGGKKGFRWGHHGKCYAERSDAEKQAEAAYAHGYAGDEALVALDRGTTRRKDADGRLHLDMTPISKANVCPYYGREIPEADRLGLEPTKLYYLYRHPDELAKAAATFNKVQLLEEHEPVHAGDPKQTITVGTLGESAVFEHPYLKNTLAVWDARAISGIETDEKKQLSSSYRYRADMTPGVTPEGVHYDGVMRDIIGNHVALVTVGRAGADVAVGDALPEDLSMAGDAFTESKHPRDKNGKFGSGGAGSAVAKLKAGSAEHHLAESNKHEAAARSAKGNKKHALLAKAHRASESYHKAMMSQHEEGSTKHEHHKGLAETARKTAEHHEGIVKNFKNDGSTKARDSRAAQHREDGQSLRHRSPGAADANTVENPMKKQGTKRLAMRVALGQYLRPALASDAAPIPYDKLIAQDATPKQIAAATKRHYAKSTEVNTGELAELLQVAADEAEKEEAEDEEEEEEEEGAEDEEEEEEEDRASDRRRGKDGKRAGDRKRGKDGKRGKDVGAGGPEDRSRGEDRKAHDAALLAQGRTDAMKDFQALRAAEEAVRPLVGSLAAMDSAEAVYRHALETVGVDLDGVHASAFPALVKMEIANRSKRGPATTHAADGATASADFATKYPNARRPGRI